MKKIVSLLAIFSLSVFFSCSGGISGSIESLTGKNTTSTMNILGARASQKALSMLNLSKGKKMLVLTNAGYAKPQGHSSAEFTDGITAMTGCTPGASTLGVIHTTKAAPLWMSVTDQSGNSLYIQIKPEASGYSRDQAKNKTEAEIFSAIETRNTSTKELTDASEKFNSDIKKGMFGGNLFRITGISNAWLHPSFDNEIFRAMMLHNHFCPGLGSGCLIARYAEKMLPLEEKESYVVISCPNWCKEDAFIEFYDSTPGKRGLVVKELDPAQKKAYDARYKGIAGIIIKWNGKKKAGSGMVVGFDFSAVTDKKCDEISKKGLGTVSKLYKDKLIMDSMNTPEKYVRTIKKFRVSKNSFSRLKQAGVNPLKELGI